MRERPAGPLPVAPLASRRPAPAEARQTGERMRPVAAGVRGQSGAASSSASRCQEIALRNRESPLRAWVFRPGWPGLAERSEPISGPRVTPPHPTRAHAPLHPPDQQLLKKDRQPRRRDRASLHALQLLPDSPNLARHASDGSGNQQSRLVDSGNRHAECAACEPSSLIGPGVQPIMSVMSRVSKNFLENLRPRESP